MSIKTVVRQTLTAGSGLGVSAIPVLGYFWAGWTPATTMMLYLLENIIGAALVALRVGLLRPPAVQSDPYSARQWREQLQTFILVAGGFSLASAIFMIAFLFTVLKLPLELPALGAGLTNMGLFLLFGFAADLVLGQPLDSPTAEAHYKRSLGRVFLLFLAVFVGVWLASIREPWFLLPFVILKTLADLDGPLQWVVTRLRPGRRVIKRTADQLDSTNNP
ncbi:MAG TPA: DUF6498-containing protein [Caldilineaceae bacterium]|nr:DUF6498-containing protein [Caldilineaceae bacterium]